MLLEQARALAGSWSSASSWPSRSPTTASSGNISSHHVQEAHLALLVAAVAAGCPRSSRPCRVRGPMKRPISVPAVRPAARLSSPTYATRRECDRSEISVTTGTPRSASVSHRFAHERMLERHERDAVARLRPCRSSALGEHARVEALDRVAAAAHVERRPVRPPHSRCSRRACAGSGWCPPAAGRRAASARARCAHGSRPRAGSRGARARLQHLLHRRVRARRRGRAARGPRWPSTRRPRVRRRRRARVPARPVRSGDGLRRAPRIHQNHQSASLTASTAASMLRRTASGRCIKEHHRTPTHPRRTP